MVEGDKVGKIMNLDGFRYERNKTTTQKIYWRCWRRNCRATLHTNHFTTEQGMEIIRRPMDEDHTHPADAFRTEIIEVR